MTSFVEIRVHVFISFDTEVYLYLYISEIDPQEI